MRTNDNKDKIDRIEESINSLNKTIMELRDSENTFDQITKKEIQKMRDNLREQWEYETGEYWNDFSADELHDMPDESGDE